MKTKGSFRAQAEPTHYSLIRDDHTRTGGGPCGLSVEDTGVPYVVGLRYEITFEVVGADPHSPPQLFHYVPQYAAGREDEAKHKLSLRGKAALTPSGKEYMRGIIKLHDRARKDLVLAMKIWKAALMIPDSDPIPEARGTAR